MNHCPRCGADVSTDVVQGGGESNHHHRTIYSCGECGWDSGR